MKIIPRELIRIWAAAMYGIAAYNLSDKWGVGLSVASAVIATTVWIETAYPNRVA